MAVGTKMPGWINAGFSEYAKRLPRECRLELVEIALAKRSKATTIDLIREREGEKMISLIPNNSHVVALDMEGDNWSTEQLASKMNGWIRNAAPVALLIGGPDGLSADCKLKASQKWSLSALTLPHLLVRVIVAEQIYRAWSLMKGHPYHRGSKELHGNG
jgi:23S rRNA (pseudouridine1915-N3)-methyltransferase|tara:strand:- start:1808 stop:2287 length:480 start_codon:yes stop_codon:yes gene_type:complete